MANVQLQSNESEYSPELANIICDFLQQYKYPVCIIYGNPDTGKTDAGCLIAEIGLNEKVLDHFASNIHTGEKGQKITSLDEVKYWHRHQIGKKLFILDEAGINDDARSPLSRLNREIRHEIFIARKFFVHWIFIIQELKDIDNWKSSNLTGMGIRKDSYAGEFRAEITCKWDSESTPINGFPKTTIPYDTLDIAPFTLDRQVSDLAVELKGLHAKAAYLYAKSGNLTSISNQFTQETGKKWHNMQIKRLIQQYIAQTLRAQDENESKKEITETEKEIVV